MSRTETVRYFGSLREVINQRQIVNQLFREALNNEIYRIFVNVSITTISLTKEKYSPYTGLYLIIG